MGAGVLVALSMLELSLAVLFARLSKSAAKHMVFSPRRIAPFVIFTPQFSKALATITGAITFRNAVKKSVIDLAMVGLRVTSAFVHSVKVVASPTSRQLFKVTLFIT